MKIARVFPRRTKATPDDPLAFTGPPPRGGLPDIEEVHVSVTFTYDMEKACQLAEQWMKLGVPVHMGDQINKLLRVQHQLTQRLGRDPSVEELAEALEVPPKKVENDTTIVSQVTQFPSIIAKTLKPSLSLTITQPSKESEKDFLNFKNNITISMANIQSYVS